MMYLKLDLNGFDLYLRISHYRTSNQANWDEEWCTVDLTVNFGKEVNLLRTGETMLSCEVEQLKSVFADLLENKIKERTFLNFIEPDFEFIINPDYHFRNESDYGDDRVGQYLKDIFVDFHIYYWNGGLTDNYLSITLYREEIEYFLTYLKLVTRQLKKSDKEITILIEKGIILDYQP